jgi:hypothetical protein
MTLQPYTVGFTHTRFRVAVIPATLVASYEHCLADYFKADYFKGAQHSSRPNL